jgi:hypothetical protein
MRCQSPFIICNLWAAHGRTAHTPLSRQSPLPLPAAYMPPHFCFLALPLRAFLVLPATYSRSGLMAAHTSLSRQSPLPLPAAYMPPHFCFSRYTATCISRATYSRLALWAHGPTHLSLSRQSPLPLPAAYMPPHFCVSRYRYVHFSCYVFDSRSGLMAPQSTHLSRLSLSPRLTPCNAAHMRRRISLAIHITFFITICHGQL